MKKLTKLACKQRTLSVHKDLLFSVLQHVIRHAPVLNMLK